MADSDSSDVETTATTTTNKDEVATRAKSTALDIADHNDELDYEEDEEHEKKANNHKEKTGHESDGEIVDDDTAPQTKTTTSKRYRRQETGDDKEEGEEDTSGSDIDDDDDEDDEKKQSKYKRDKSERGAGVAEDSSSKKPEEEPPSEEEGEINDGEKVKKTFIPRVLCKYYQRGKCSWGRNCKFLHPGVNDTGNYNFLEYQDPNAKVFQQQSTTQPSVDVDAPQTAASSSKEDAQSAQTESAWERGLRHAKEMKERAMRRKQMEKDQFDDKKMNLSLKDFENEKENDERYVNAERPANQEDEEQEDEEIRAYASRLNRPSNNQASRESSNQEDRSYPSGGYSRPSNYRPQNAYEDKPKGDVRSKVVASGTKSNEQKRPATPPHRGPKSRPDEWNDPWDRSRPTRKGVSTSANNQRRTSNSYSSSDSESRSRSRSRSSYSSKSSYSSRSSSYSDRSNSPAATTRNRNKPAADPKRKPGGTAQKAVTKSVVSSVATAASNKSLPGRGVSDLSLKKANIPSTASVTAAAATTAAATSSGAVATTKKKRTHSNSSASSYSSSSSSSSNESKSDASSTSASSSESSTGESDASESDDNEDEDLRRPAPIVAKKPVKSAVTVAQKRPAGGVRDSSKATTSGNATKKAKTSNSPPRSKDKKQLIKDQLKLLESALKKKAMSK